MLCYLLSLIVNYAVFYLLSLLIFFITLCNGSLESRYINKVSIIHIHQCVCSHRLYIILVLYLSGRSLLRYNISPLQGGLVKMGSTEDK